MEFEELQQIWDVQNNQPLYAINEQALHNRIVAKKYQVIHIVRISEWILIVTNTASGIFTFWINNTGRQGIFVYLMAAWMLVSALYVLISCIRRVTTQPRFDRSLLGDLQYALATAGYQVRLSAVMRWNILPIGVWVVLVFWEAHKPWWIGLGAACFILLVFYATRWEHAIYQSKKRELQTLLNKLQQV